MDAAELDIEDLPPKALRKLIRSMLAKAGKTPDKKADDKSDEEREALSDLHEEHKGKAPKVPVTEDDLPFEQDDEDEEKEEDGEEETSKVPPAKSKKGK
jgi:hypothetical protein